jgi:DNA-binding protein HU-beta
LNELWLSQSGFILITFFILPFTPKNKKMNKTELVNEIAKKTELEKTKISLILNSFLDTVTESLAKHENVSLIGFGSFQVRHRKSRKGVNPQTRKIMTIPATDVPVISFSDNLKQAVAQKKKIKSFGKKAVTAGAKKKVADKAKISKTSAKATVAKKKSK